MRRLVFLAVVSLASCGEGDSFEDCALGELTGTWRFSYVETDGTCGAIADETAVFMPGAETPAGCTTFANQVSADRCRMDLDYECVDQGLSVRWTLVLHHIAADAIDGTGTVQADDGFDYCRSTYDISVRRL